MSAETFPDEQIEPLPDWNSPIEYLPPITDPLYDEERKAMQFWIFHQKEFMSSKEDPYDPNNVNFNLFALINSINAYQNGMSRECLKHMRRMIAIEATHFSDVSDPFLKNTLEQVLEKQLKEVRDYEKDFSDAPDHWQLAYSDLKLSHHSEDIVFE